jgi:hypothetical protein
LANEIVSFVEPQFLLRCFDRKGTFNMPDSLKKMMKDRLLKCKELVPWVTAVLVVLSSNWASNSLWETFQVWSSELGIFSLSKTLSILFFSGCVVLLYLQRNRFFRPRTRYLKDKINPLPHKHLVFFLSTLNPNNSYNNGVPDGLPLTNDLEKDLEEMLRLKKAPTKIVWNWEMPLRALWYHAKKDVLETATIICSKESKDEVSDFLNICKGYDKLKKVEYYLLLHQKWPELLPARNGIPKSSTGWDFESFDEQSEALIYFLETFINKEHREEDIIIDFTSGQKVTSVVAAVCTFNRKIKAQYVQTGGNCDVISYDVLFVPSDTGGFGI